MEKRNELKTGFSICDNCSGVATVITDDGRALCSKCAMIKTATEEKPSLKSAGQSKILARALKNRTR